MAKKDNDILLEKLSGLQWSLCRFMRERVLTKSADELSAVAREGDDDTIYVIDVETEDFITDYFDKNIGPEIPCVLVAEGMEEGGVAFGPRGRAAAEWTVIMDPLDGTRGLMYGKRSAWTLAGAARGAGADLTLKDIEIAVQTEIPPPKQGAADQLSAVRGRGARGVRRFMATDSAAEFEFAPSGAKTLNYGFATFSRFFPGIKDVITEVEIEFNRRLEELGEKFFYFEDQYICTGGQLAEVALGRDRFVCDLRAALTPVIVARGGAAPLCVHPYDICTELIAREAGAIVTDAAGGQLSAPLDTTTGVSFLAYCNEHIRGLVEPILLNIIETTCNIS